MAAPRKLAMIMGVANQRSIAWGCVQAFLNKGYNCVFTFQNSKHRDRMEQLVASNKDIIGCLSCDVAENQMQPLFQERLPELIQDRRIDCVVHSIAHARNMDRPLVETSLEDYLYAQHVSAYSFLEVVRCSHEHYKVPSYVALSYLGATRAVPNYGVMGPAKAALESLVRGLSLELHVRCNAVSAGPVRTAAARGIPGFDRILSHVESTAPLQCNVTMEQVGETVVTISEATGMAGQVVHVDAGYSSVVPLLQQ